MATFKQFALNELFVITRCKADQPSARFLIYSGSGRHGYNAFDNANIGYKFSQLFENVAILPEQSFTQHYGNDGLTGRTLLLF